MASIASKVHISTAAQQYTDFQRKERAIDARKFSLTLPSAGWQGSTLLVQQGIPCAQVFSGCGDGGSCWSGKQLRKQTLALNSKSQPRKRSVATYGKQNDAEVSTQDQRPSAEQLKETETDTAQNGGLRHGDAGANGAAGQPHEEGSESELLTMVKDGVEAVKGAVVEEAAIVAEVVGEGMEVAAQTVASVGELPTETAALEEADRQKAVKTVAFWVTSAVLFGLGLGYSQGTSKASEFFAGYLLEQSLSVDNLLVFVLIFSYFKVPLPSQARVLTYGIAGAVVFRGIMIGLGVATIEAFSAINLVFAGILLFSSYKLLADSGDDDEEDLSNNSVVLFCQRFIKVTSDYDGDKFFTLTNGMRKATPLLLTLAVVELSDIVFAVDSIPAVFGVTRDPFVVFSSNIFAILGLRSLYLLVSTSIADLHYLQPSVAWVLGFIGCKMIVEFFGIDVSTELSLGVVATVLGAGVILSLKYPQKEDSD